MYLGAALRAASPFFLHTLGFMFYGAKVFLSLVATPFEAMAPYHAADEGALAPEKGSEEDTEDQRIVSQAEPEVVDMHTGAGGKEDKGESEPAEDAPHRIGHTVVTLANEVAEQYTGTIASQATPSTGHIAYLGHQQHVDHHQHGTTHGTHDGTPVGLGRQLIPEREVEIDTMSISAIMTMGTARRPSQ